MHVLSHWEDELAFHAADPRRRTSDVVDLGATWRWEGSNEAHRVAWVRLTGELYVCRADGYDGECTDVSVLAVLTTEADLDRAVDGWREFRTDPDGLSWLAGRLQPLAA